MRKRITDSEFRKRVKQKYGDQFTVISDYHGVDSKIKVKCNKCGWIGEVRANNLIYQNYGSRCPTHGNEGNAKNFFHKIRQKYGDRFEILSDYHGMRSKIKVKCNKCGWIGEVQARNLIRCECGSRCPIHGNGRFDSSSFQKLINQKQNNQYTLLSKFANLGVKVKIKCNKCGKIFKVWPDNLLHRRFGKNCKHTVKLNFKQASILLGKIFNKKIKLVHFSGMGSVATFECCKCGNVWRAAASSVFDSLTGCPTCSSSKGEKAVDEYLKKHHMAFQGQFRLVTCRDKKPLPFDFAVFNQDGSLNSLIEYQGCQHFMDLSQFKKNDFFSKESVLSTQKHDKMKSTFCQKHGIKLIRINHPQNAGESNKYSFIANLVKRTLDKELKAS